MEQRGRELDSWDELVEKAINAEAKVSLQPTSIIREMDQRCPRGNRPLAVSKSQASSTRDSREEPSDKAQSQDLNSSHSSQPHSSQSENIGETSDKKARKEKKKQRRLEDERARKDSTLATGINASNVPNGGTRKDLSYITCFNCDKKGHYVTKCPEPRKDASSEN